MKEKFSDLFTSAGALWRNASPKARRLLIAAGAGIVLFCLVAAYLLNRTNYELLYNYNSLSVQETEAVFSALNDAGIQPQVRSDGSIYVTDKEIDRARMQLATRGYANSGLSYDAYNAAAGKLTATQADKEVAKLQQLQDRLQATIETFDEVSAAIVTISLPSTGGFAWETDNTPATASVSIRKMAGRELSREQVRGILNIVKNSVAGLAEENISITDETGDLKLHLESGAGGLSGKLDLTEQVNRSIENNILTILQPVYGSDNVKVSVYATLDSDQRITEQTEYQPADAENPQSNPLESQEIYREKSGGAAPAEGVPGANDNVNVPQYGAGGMDVADGDSYVASDAYNYLVNNVRSQVVKEGYDISNLSVAVVIDSSNVSLTREEQNAVTNLVARAAGMTDADVIADSISVQTIRFNRPVAETPAEIIARDFPLYLIVGGLGILALVIVAAVVVAVVVRRKRAERLSLEEEYGEDGVLLVDPEGEGDGFEPITLGDSQEQKLKAQIRDLADSDPEIVAQLLKTWLVQ